MSGENRYKAVALLSDGIDSPVAAYLMLKKGVDVVALHMDNGPQARNALDKVKLLVRRLEDITGKEIPLFIAPHYPNHMMFVSRCAAKYHCVLCKRTMLRAAEMLAIREGADFLLTGGSLGQVASQTLKNLRAEEEAVGIPVVRPLIGMDKDDIVGLAREIGTYDISILPGACCGMVPEHPVTRARLEEVLENEENLPLSKMLEAMAEGIRPAERYQN